MGILLKNLNSEQAEAIQRLAKLLNIGVQEHSRTELDAAMMRAIQESQSEGILNVEEKAAFLNRLSRK